MTPQIRNIILFGGIGLLLVFIYFSFIKGDEATDGALVVNPATGLPPMPGGPSVTGNALPVSGASSAITSELLSVLLNIKNIRLDDSIFTEPAFLSLKDSTITLIQDSTEGRPNPFAPIGADTTSTAPASSSSSSSTSTSSGGASGGAGR